MTILTGLEESAHNPEEELLQKLAQAIDDLVARMCGHHYTAPTQEHQLTARLAEAIEHEIERFPIEVRGVRLEVKTQDFPDRGSRSMERRSGADLYIGRVPSGGVARR
jgi:hypothetical protein